MTLPLVIAAWLAWSAGGIALLRFTVDAGPTTTTTTTERTLT